MGARGRRRTRNERPRETASAGSQVLGRAKPVVICEGSRLRPVGEKLLRSLDILRARFEGSAGLQQIIERARAGTHRRLAGDASGSLSGVLAAKLSDLCVVAVAEDRRGFLAHPGDHGYRRPT